MHAPRRVVVVGGGVAGLAAARAAARAPDVEVVLLEATDRLGGRVSTIDAPGRMSVDVGPEALVTYQPGVLETCRELGIDGLLVAPAVNETRLFARGALRPMPERIMEGAPGGAWSILRSGVLSPRGVLRAGLDRVLPRTSIGADASIGELVEARLGREAAERLVDPLLGGVHAGSIWRLDAGLLAPQVVRALERDRSLVRGMRRLAAERRASRPDTGAAAPPPSPFRTLDGGLRTLVDALARSARERGVDLRAGARVERIDSTGAVHLAAGEVIDADAVVVAAPAPAAARVVGDAAPAAAVAMRGVRWASTVTCVVGVPAASASQLVGLSGVLVPRREGEHIKAITCVTGKWGHDPHEGDIVLKCYLGHADDDSPVTQLADDELVERTTRALRRIAGVDAPPSWTHITRYPDAIPQYEPGHARRVELVEQSVADGFAGRVTLAGASWHGSGIGSCLAGGARAGEAAAATASTTPTRRLACT